LQTGCVPERCAAALALAELGPKSEPARSALLGVLNDVEKSVVVAAQIAIGFVYIRPEIRRNMFEHLVGPDDYLQHTAVASLAELAYTNLLGTAAPPEDEAVPPETLTTSIVSASSNPPSVLPQAAPMLPTQGTPDIATAHVFPWWFLLGGFALCILMAWVMRGIWWSKWTMLAALVVTVAILLYARTRRENGVLSPTRFRAHARLAGAVILATASGFVVCVMFPTGQVYIDNASTQDVRILVDGSEWLTIASTESTRRSLGRGKHRLSIQSKDGTRDLDEYDIEVAAYQQHVCNVLGAQVYFHGWVHFGIRDPGRPKVVVEKWFQIPHVDYLFRDPPDVIFAKHPEAKKYFVKAQPPRF
jgi:hypothetical protein